MRQDDKGFSLIELVVVIAIMMIMIGIAGTSIANMSHQKVKAALKMADSQLTYLQTLAMSKNMAYGEVMLEDDSYYFRIVVGLRDQEEKAKKKLGSSKDINIQYKTTANSAKNNITEGHPLHIDIDKSSGSCKDFSQIIISQRSYSGVIQMYPKTGKHEIVLGE